MAAFPSLELEEKVQVDDKTRLDGTKSFISKGTDVISSVRIRPEASGSFSTVTGSSSKDWFLDWVYSTAGTKTVTIEITTNTTPVTVPTVVTKDFTIEVVTEATDKLFSKDSDLQIYEPDILKYVRAGRNTFKDIHRKAQTMIIKSVDEDGWVDSAHNKITLSAFLDLDEVRQWSTYLVLRLIFEGLSNVPNDIFDMKMMKYKSFEQEARTRTALRLDLDGDGLIDKAEYLPVTSPRLVRT